MAREKYSDAHILFLQGMLSNPVLSEEEAVDLLNSVSGNDRGDAKKAEAHVATINNEIRRFFMNIKKHVCEVTGFVNYALVSTFHSPDDAYDKLVHKYSLAERDYFRLVLEQIVSSDERCISQNMALNLTMPSSSQSQCFGPRDNSDFMDTFVKDGWIVRGDDRRLFLGSRAIAEFENLLTTAYKLSGCSLCHAVCVASLRCENEDCGEECHPHCLQIFRKGSNSCPKCRSEMKHVSF